MIESPEIAQDALNALALRKYQLLTRQKELRKEFGLAYYRPSAKQHLFHAAGNRKRRMVRAGNRFGKSIMGCAEDCAWLQGERPWYAKGDPLRTLGIPQRPIKGLVITTDWDKVDEIFTSQRGTEGKLWQFLPKGWVKSTKRNHSGAIDTVEGHNGALLKFDTVKSYSANPQGSESSDWDFIHIDEPCSEDMWKAASRGLMDRHGSAWFTLTPLSEFWINDMFFPRDGRKVLADVIAQERWVITGSTKDNPYLTPEAIAEFEATLTEDEKDCRLNGIPLELSGLVYKGFKHEVHVLVDPPKGWKDWHTPPENYNLLFYVDPHPQTPHAVLFGAVSPHNTVYLFQEIFEHCTIQELSEQIKNVTKDRQVVQSRCDPLAFIYDPVTDATMNDEFAKHGVFMDKATKDLRHGVLAVQQALKTPGRVVVANHLHEFLWEIGRYCWTKENKPIDKDDHLMECFYRMMLDNPQWVDIAKQNTAPITDMEITGADVRVDDLDEILA